MPRLPILSVVLLISFIPWSAALANFFNYTSLSCTDKHIRCRGDTFDRFGSIELTSLDKTTSSKGRTGWATYDKLITLYNPTTGFVADFESSFSLQIEPISDTCSGNGLTFFIASGNWTPNPKYIGAGLGLFKYNENMEDLKSQIVAIEFDPYPYSLELDPSANHMGIDINSLNSTVSANWKTLNHSRFVLNGTTLIRYNSATGNLSSSLRYLNDTAQLDISLSINLTTVLPETVVIGFSAATGDCFEAHRITAWSFSATVPESATAPSPAPRTVIILGACVVPLFIILVVVMIILFVRMRRRKLAEEEEEEEEDRDGFVDVTMNFETGPRRFRYNELAAATNDFSEEGKLGQGGFGGVYKGVLQDTKEIVAVKRFSRGSSQGKKEYVAEVSVISRLRHRNLVRLIGWCHQRGEFLLVYEYMEGGSLDSHLFNLKGHSVLTWAQRKKVVLGLASAVQYLHEEWEQCVVHRDIKLSNIMVDSEFNARLGDFGLARLTDHGFATRTTMVAGTMGYLAPECVITGKASTQSDVYSFGVVLLEITTGRKAIRPIREKEVRLVEWIWELYGVGSFMEAIDERLGSEFDHQEMERMMVVGLWCVHPDPERRPTMKEAIRVLCFQAEIPSLPQKMPVPIYASPPMNDFNSLFSSSGSGTTATSTTVSSTESAEAALIRR